MWVWSWLLSSSKTFSEIKLFLKKGKMFHSPLFWNYEPPEIFSGLVASEYRGDLNLLSNSIWKIKKQQQDFNLRNNFSKIVWILNVWYGGHSLKKRRITVAVVHIEQSVWIHVVNYCSTKSSLLCVQHLKKQFLTLDQFASQTLQHT